MRAAVYRGRGRLDVTDVDLPSLGPTDLLVEVAFCGVCGTDLHNVLDGWGVPDSIGGHEWSGRVVAAGDDAPVEVGTLVVGSGNSPCGECASCRAGRSGLCSERGAIGTERVYGAFADHLVIDAAETLPVPDGVDARSAAYAEPLAVALHALTIAAPQPGERVLVSGCGPIGAALVAVLVASGHADLLVVEPADLRRNLASRLGAATCHPDDLEAPWHPGLTVDRPADVVLETSGARTAAEACLGQLAGCGRLVLVGTGLDFPRLDTGRIILNELVVTGAYNYDDDGFAAALDLIGSGSLPLDLLLEPGTIGLDGLLDTMVRLRAGEVAGKVLVRPGA
jgi:2-desacetyl-2-hydroxyethyl bacteriochlorophyllide A dehydrogenase